MAIDHTLLIRLFAGAVSLIACAWALWTLVTGRSFDRWGRRITKRDNPIRFALSVVAAVAVALIALLMAAGLVHAYQI